MELATTAKKAGEKYSKLNSPLLKPNDTSSDEIRPYALSVLDKEGPKRPEAPSHEDDTHMRNSRKKYGT